MPVPCSTSVSFARLDAPVVVRFAPFALTELAQPLPAVPLLPHGQAVPVPSPKQYGTPVGPHCVPDSVTLNLPVTPDCPNDPMRIVYICPQTVGQVNVVVKPDCV